MAVGEKAKRARSEKDKKRVYDSIISKGREMFVEQGSEGFSLRGLARELNMTHGNLYNYVDSKRDLWIEIRREDILKLRLGIESLINKHQGSILSLVDKLVIHYMNFAHEEFPSYLMMFHVSAPKSKVKSKIERQYAPINPFELMKDVVQKGVDNGEFTSKDPEYLSYLVYTLAHGATITERDMQQQIPIMEPIKVDSNHTDLTIFRNKILKTIHVVLEREDI